MGAQSPQSPQDVCDMTPEHTAHGVELVDHDVFESVEEVVPVVMGGKESGVQHVGVGEDDIGVASHPGPFLG